MKIKLKKVKINLTFNLGNFNFLTRLCPGLHILIHI